MCLAFFPDGERFAVVEISAPYFQFDGPALAIRSVETGDIMERITGAHTECDEMAVSPGGEWLVTRTRTALQAFTTGDFTAAPRTIAKSGKKRFTGLAFHPSGDYLAVSNTDATIHFYDTSTWKLVHIFTWKIGKMRSIAFSPDGTLAAAGSDNGKVVVWDVDV
jgi:WD40 repeat protein